MTGNQTPEMDLNILGTTYEIKSERIAEQDIDGQCDTTTHTIKVDPGAGACFGDPLAYRKQLLRHEIIHAFFGESGIEGDESTVEWIATQFPKMLKVFEEAECI